MDFIRKIVEKQDASIEELIDCFERVKSNGHVAAIKFDGERERDWYTVLVSFPGNKRDMIRADENDLKGALVKVLAKYIEQD